MKRKNKSARGRDEDRGSEQEWFKENKKRNRRPEKIAKQSRKRKRK